jgi:hypothetical protein
MLGFQSSLCYYLGKEGKLVDDQMSLYLIQLDLSYFILQLTLPINHLNHLILEILVELCSYFQPPTWGYLVFESWPRK